MKPQAAVGRLILWEGVHGKGTTWRRLDHPWMTPRMLVTLESRGMIAPAEWEGGLRTYRLVRAGA